MKKTIAIFLIFIQILASTLINANLAQASQVGDISTVAGSAGSGQSTALGQNPVGVASFGTYIYVADGTYNVIRRIDKASGSETIIAGGGGDQADNIPALQALILPIDVVVDGNGNLYIADRFNKVREVSASNHVQFGITMTAGNIYTIAGNGIDSYSGDNGPAYNAAVSFSLGIGRLAVDGNGNLFIARSNRIREVAATDHIQFGIAMAAGYIYSIAGNGIWGYSGDSGPAISAQISDSRGVAVDGNGNLFISDSGNNRIREVAATNTTQSGISMISGNIYTVAGNGTGGFSGDNGSAVNAELHNPEGITCDSNGNLLIADSANNRVRELAVSNHTQFGIDMIAGNIYSVAGNGTGGYSGDNGLATSGQLSSPRALTVNSDGNLYIEDYFNYRIREVAAVTSTQFGIAMNAGNIYSVVGNGTPGYSGDNGPALSAQLFTNNLSVDDSGNVYVVDYHRIREIAATNHTQFGIAMTAGNIYTVAGSGIQGYSGDNGPAIEAQLNYPQGVAVDGKGNLYISEADNHIRMVAAVNGIWFNKVMTAGNIYTVAGNGTSGYSGDNGLATSAELNSPWGVAVDDSGNLFIADSNNHCIREVAGINSTQYGKVMIAGNIYTITGTGSYGFSGDNGPASSAKMDAPRAVTVDSRGNLYIADTFNYRIREVPAINNAQFGITMTAGNIYTVAGNGTSGSSGDNGLASSAKLGRPEGVSVDGNGNLFIADSTNECVREVAATDGTQYGIVMTTGNIYSVAGNGIKGYSGDNGPATSAQLNYPSGVTVQRGNLYISDRVNMAIRFVNAGITVPDSPTGITATVSGSSALVSFTPPQMNCGSPITSYTVTSYPDSITAKGSSGSISVNGLTYGKSYTFTVTATNAAGAGLASVESNSITIPMPAGGNSPGQSDSGRSSGQPSNPQPGSELLVSSIVQDGTASTVKATDGTQILLPADALPKGQQLNLTISEDNVSIGPNPSTTLGYDPKYTERTFGPSGTVFNSCVTITIPFNGVNVESNDIPRLAVYLWQDNRWLKVGGVVDPVNKTITVTVNHFSTYRIMADRTAVEERIGGFDRYETAVKIAQNYFAAGADTVVLTRGDISADALTAVPLARYFNAPLLLTPQDRLPEKVINEIKTLGVKTVYIIGGEMAVSRQIANEITGQGIKVQRVAGLDRYDTSYEVAKLIGHRGQAVIVNGNDYAYPDALSVSSWAAYNGVPILYADGTNQLPEVTAKALTEFKVSRTILVGGTAVLSKSLEGLVPNSERYAGLDRYGSNTQVLSKLQPNPVHIFAVTGNDFADALAGAAIASQSNSWLLLIGAQGDTFNGLAMDQQEQLRNAKGSVLDLHVFGGIAAVPDKTLNDIRNILGR